MKRFFRILCAMLAALALTLTVSCGGDEIEYTMKRYTSGALSYEIPEHYQKSEHVEAQAYYITLNSAITVYSYTHAEFSEAYAYGGDFSATDVATHIVTRNGYESNVSAGAVDGSAFFSFLFTNGESSAAAYYINLTLTNDEHVCMISFSCPSEKLDTYQPLIDEILTSVSIGS